MINNNNDSEYCLSSGAFAKICNTTRDTLRYYEKEGILIPVKNEQNGYKYYSHAQITSFYFISTFRKLDCNVQDIYNLISDNTVNFNDFVYHQYETLLEMKKDLDRKLSTLEGGLGLIDMIKHSTGPHPILDKFASDTYIITTPISSYPANCFSDIIPDFNLHISICDTSSTVNTFPVGAIIPKNNFLNDSYSYSDIFSFAINCNNISNSSIHKLPSRDIVSLVYRGSGSNIKEAYNDIKDYIGKNHLKICSNIFSVSLVNVVDKTLNHRYLKYIFVCVK